MTNDARRDEPNDEHTEADKQRDGRWRWREAGRRVEDSMRKRCSNTLATEHMFAKVSDIDDAHSSQSQTQ